MKIGILQTGHVAHDIKHAHGDYVSMFQKLMNGRGFTFNKWNVVDSIFPKTINCCDAWLITGSRHGVYEPHPWIAPLEKFIRECYSANTPMIGVCFGHQIIAQALGGHVVKHDYGWNIGRQEFFFGDRQLFLNCWHQDQVVELPPDTDIIATSHQCKYAALNFASRAISVQPHPEFDHNIISALIKTRGKNVEPKDRLEVARTQLSQPVDGDIIADMFMKFLYSRKIPTMELAD